MDEQKKQQLKAEITVVKSLLSTTSSSTSSLSQTTFPVTGPVVNIPPLAMAAQAFKVQNDCMERLAKLVEKVIEEL